MWIEKSPVQDGSGTYSHRGEEFKIVVQDLVSTKHRVAFRGGKEIARASSFARLLRKLDQLSPSEQGERE